MQRSLSIALGMLGGLTVSGLGIRRVAAERAAARLERDLQTVASPPESFSDTLVAGSPEPARRYLRHALAPGAPLASSVRLRMDGRMKPSPGGSPLALTAEETLAPRRGFVWTARTSMFGLPVQVRDHYFDGDGGVRVRLGGLIPLPSDDGPGVVRSSRGRLVAEAVWCPTALAGPDVEWEAAGPDRATFTLAVDGERIPVTIHVGPDGAVRAVALMRWGNVGVPTWQPIPYGFAVEEEGTFGGVTIPTSLRGGWWYGTDRFDSEAAATFEVTAATF